MSASPVRTETTISTDSMDRMDRMDDPSHLYVIKRNGRKEPMHFDKITKRLKGLLFGKLANHSYIVPEVITQKIVSQLVPGITTSQIDELAADTCAYMGSRHPDYAILAARILVSNLHKNTLNSFARTVELIHRDDNYFDPKFYEFVMQNAAILDNAIMHAHDYDYDFFAIKTLIDAYLLKTIQDTRIAERPQYMLMRIAVALNLDSVQNAIETYNLLSERKYIHATPTLYHAGKHNGQLASCFLAQIPHDSIESMYNTNVQCAKISKHAGGIGLAIHKIRGRGALIKSSRGKSNGIIPMLRVYNETARHCDQGGGRRKGGFSIYLEPWHSDIFEFLALRKNNGAEHERCRDLFTALWIPDLFMKRVKNREMWSLFDNAMGLADVYGAEFEKLYKSYEEKGLYVKQVPAESVWKAIIESQQQTGTPYILFKDASNEKSNHKHLGTIQSSNLCCEIMEYTSENEIAVCNLASINYPAFVTEDGQFDFVELARVARIIIRNLNRVIHTTYYPVPEARHSNMRHKPIGLGDMGLADVFQKLRMPYESEDARQLNRDIAECMYFACMDESCNLAMNDASLVYPSFKGSPASQGILQFDMWGVTPSNKFGDFGMLKEKIMTHGLANSLVRALMPTATTAQIMGSNESFEPFSSNLYVRQTKAGNFIVMNKYLVNDLQKISMWNQNVIDQLMKNYGSIQNIDGIPQDIKNLYKIVWEIPKRAEIDMSADRGPFVCQSQSLNIHTKDVSYDNMTRILFYGWSRGLKTAMYYLRTKAATEAIQFTLPLKGNDGEGGPVCSRESNCTSCQ